MIMINTSSTTIRPGLGDSLKNETTTLKVNANDFSKQLQSLKQKAIITLLGSASVFWVYKYVQYRKYQKIKQIIKEEMKTESEQALILFIPKVVGSTLYNGCSFFFKVTKYVLGGLLYSFSSKKNGAITSYNQNQERFSPGLLLAWCFGRGKAETFHRKVLFPEKEQKQINEYERYIADQKKESGGYISLIGNTPVIKIKCLSEELGCNIYAKFEGMNPGGSSKDRVALQMILDAEENGKLRYQGTRKTKNGSLTFCDFGGEKCTVVEGTSGSTGISLANIAKQRGYDVTIVMPNDQSQEKIKMLSNLLKVNTVIVPPCSISNPNHYCKKAQEIAENHPRTHVFMDQFETLSNFKAHYMGTGVEIIYQLEDLGVSKLDAFVMSAGTGGSIAGISKRLKEYYQNKNHGSNLSLTKRDVDFIPISNTSTVKETSKPIFASLYGEDRTSTTNTNTVETTEKLQKKQYQVSHHEMQNIASASKNIRLPRVVLADPPGSSLYNKVRYGICYAPEQKERNIRKHRYDTIVEGVGLDRITKNFELAEIDDAFSCTDQEILDMAHYILDKEGLCIGSSTALNLCAVVKTAYSLGWNGKQDRHLSENDRRNAKENYSGTILTIICDQGSRHMSRFWNQEYCEQHYNIKWPTKAPETLTSFLNFKDVHLLQNHYRYTSRNEQSEKDQKFLKQFLFYSLASLGLGASVLVYGYCN